MLFGDIVDQFHDDNSFAHARSAEQADLAALQEGLDQVDDLHAGFEHLGGRGLLIKSRRGAVNRHGLRVLDRTELVHGLANHIHDPPQGA